MLVYTIKRLTLAVPTLILVAIIVFALMRAIPGDPALLFVGDIEDPAAVEAMRRELGLDQPIVFQFLTWLGSVVTGDLGRSIATGEPVTTMLLDRFPVTAQIVALAVLFAALLAIPGGVYAAWRQNSASDAAIVVAATLGLSIPSFWLGLILLLVFGVELGWLPTIGYVSPFEDFGAGIVYLVLPVLTLVLTEMATLARMSRASTIEVLRLEYITHARAKGLTEGVVLWRHAFRNAFAPTLTVLGLILGHLLGGLVVLETVFSLPGLGRMLVDAIYQRDYPVVQGCLLLVALVYIAVNLVVDLLYPLFDPRVRL